MLDKDHLRSEALRLLLESEGLGIGLQDREALAALLWRMESFIPESTPDAVREAEGDDADQIPFLSEAFLYPLLGKEDARTVLALWDSIRESLGFQSWPPATTIERALYGSFTPIEERSEADLQRGKRLGFMEQDESGEWKLTEAGKRRQANSLKTHIRSRRVWGVELLAGPNAGTRIECQDDFELREFQDMFRVMGTQYRILLEPVGEGGEPEPLT